MNNENQEVTMEDLDAQDEADFLSWTPIGELEWNEYPICPSCGSRMSQPKDFTHGCGNMCYMCS